MCLHPQTLTHQPLSVFCRAGEHWGIQDLVAVDPVGRLHLFEIKKGTVTPRHAEQLEAYLLEFVFRDPDDFYVEWRARYTEQLLGVRLAVYLAGALCGKRTSNLGFKFIQDVYGSEIQISEAEYRKLDRGGRLEWVLEGLVRHLSRKAWQRAGNHATGESLRHSAAMFSTKLAGMLPDKLPDYRLPRRAVIWLVGKRFDGHALQRVRCWRTAGIDARPLEAEVRLLEGGR